MHHSTARILTTHRGGPPRPHSLLDLLEPHAAGQTPTDSAALDAIAEGAARPAGEALR